MCFVKQLRISLEVERMLTWQHWSWWIQRHHMGRSLPAHPCWSDSNARERQVRHSGNYMIQMFGIIAVIMKRHEASSTAGITGSLIMLLFWNKVQIDLPLNASLSICLSRVESILQHENTLVFSSTKRRTESILKQSHHINSELSVEMIVQSDVSVFQLIHFFHKNVNL